MENKGFKRLVMEKLKKLDSNFAGDGSCIAWTTFQYNRENLKVVETVLDKLNWRNDEYGLTYDENLIFVKKDLF